MLSPIGDRALLDALGAGRALIKFISANDVGITGGHQCGFYLPKAVWQAFTPHEPLDGRNDIHDVQIMWPDGLITDSRVHWYGNRTRSEYRLTCFGRGFPWISWNSSENVGDLLVLVLHSLDQFSAYILDLEEDIESLLAGLGIEITDTWGYYDVSQDPEETEDRCLNREFREFVQELENPPSVSAFSETTIAALLRCVNDFDNVDPDTKLLRLEKEEFVLYKMAERYIFGPRVQRLYTSIDDFLTTANSILQARKSRAGRTLENHMEYLLSRAGIPFDIRPTLDRTKPDIVIPGVAQYEDPSYPVDDIFIVGIKRTCKDRWRQVTREAPRVPRKHILTLQRGVSTSQFAEMTSLNISLVVPKQYHSDFPPEIRSSLLSIESFLIDIAEHIHND